MVEITKAVSLLDAKSIPEVHLGTRGVFRERVRPCTISAENDIEAIDAWLGTLNSVSTKRAYKKEIFRLLLWASTKKNKPISSLTEQDYIQFEAFLKNPTPRYEWCGPRARAGTDKWRPMVEPLTNESAYQALTVIHAMLNYLTQRGYLSICPIYKRRKPDSLQSGAPKIAFTSEEKTLLFTLIDEMPEDTKQKIYLKGRLRVTTVLFIAVGLRRAEIVALNMGDVLIKSVAGGRSIVGLSILGKGDKRDFIPLSQEALAEVIRWRHLLGFAEDFPLSEIDKKHPLVPSHSGRRLTVNPIYNSLKALFELASSECNDPISKVRFSEATPHTLRHTGITDVGYQADIRTQSKFARHSNINTTISIYDHRGLSELSDAVNGTKVDVGGKS